MTQVLNRSEFKHIVVFCDTKAEMKDISEKIILGIGDQIKVIRRYDDSLIKTEDEKIIIETRPACIYKCGGLHPDYILFATCNTTFIDEFKVYDKYGWIILNNVEELIDVFIKESAL